LNVDVAGINRQKYTKTFDSSNIFYELRFQLTIEYLKLHTAYARLFSTPRRHRDHLCSRLGR
jgi:hypothetical protein